MFFQSKKRIEVKLELVLKEYAAIANADPNTLRLLIPAQDMWRLHVDGLMQHKGWRDYENRQPGCLLAMSNAFNALWKYNSKIDAHVIMNLQKLTTKNVRGTNYDHFKKASSNFHEQPGRFRQNVIHDSSIGGCYVYKSNLTKAGLREFLHKTNKQNSEYAISLEVTEHGYDSSTFEDMIINKHFVHDARTIAQSKVQSSPRQILAQMSAYFYADLIEYLSNKPDDYLNPYIELIKLIGNTRDDVELANVLHKFIISKRDQPNRAIFDVLMVSMQNKNTYNQLVNDTNEIMQRYYQLITTACAPIDKLIVIVKTIQSLEQLHPFIDANCRTFCMLLLNKLLVENGFPLAILPDPNRFDLYSVHELLIDVIAGMENTFTLIKEQQLYGYEVPKFDIHSWQFQQLYFNEDKGRREMTQGDTNVQRYTR